MVLDDLMEAAEHDKRVLDLFTKGSHHRNVPVFGVICVKTFFPWQVRQEHLAKCMVNDIDSSRAKNLRDKHII